MELVLTQPGTIQLADGLSAETQPGPCQALVEVKVLSLCGSDYKLFAGSYGGPDSYPIRFGHEWGGQVVRAGSLAGVQAGDRVTGDCSRWCGRCDRCLINRNLCRTIEKFGISQDGFSSHFRLVEGRYLYVDRHGLDFEDLALVEIFAVAWMGIERLVRVPKRDDRILILGGGPLGLACALLLHYHYGVAPMTLVETGTAKAAFIANAFPFLDLKAPCDTDPFAALGYGQLQELAAFDLVFECTGQPAAINEGLLLTQFGGEMVSFGLGLTADVNLNLMVAKGLSLYGSIGGTGAFPQVMAFLARHRLAVAPLITHRVAAAQLAHSLPRIAADPTRIKAQIAF